jgi:hypothetical protein
VVVVQKDQLLERLLLPQPVYRFRPKACSRTKLSILMMAVQIVDFPRSMKKTSVVDPTLGLAAGPEATLALDQGRLMKERAVTDQERKVRPITVEATDLEKVRTRSLVPVPTTAGASVRVVRANTLEVSKMDPTIPVRTDLAPVLVPTVEVRGLVPVLVLTMEVESLPISRMALSGLALSVALVANREVPTDLGLRP